MKTTPKNNTSATALYIVGGTANASDYEGLQRFTFADGQWETLRPTVAVTQNRLYHSAVYLNSSDSILVYAGTQDGSKQASSQTFTIQASEPYTVLAFQAIAPPGINPLLMQWTESEAVYIGGSDTNKNAMIFSPSNSWVDSNATLAEPLYNTSAIKAVVINGDDASKTLYTFDMTVIPNSVNRTILIDGDGNPVENADPIVGKRGLEEALEDLDERSTMLVKRDNLTVADWPPYNDTLAPSSIRTSYSVAQDPSGLVVISGGNQQDVLCIFEARDNCWANASATLSLKAQTLQVLGPSTTTSPSTASQTSASSTATATTTTTAMTAADPPFPAKILGIVLGSIMGIALILLGILLLLRWRRKRRQHSDAGHQRRSSGIPDEKDTMDFLDRGLPQMSLARSFRGHEQQTSQGSFSSMAILMGRVGHKRGEDKNGSLGSDSSSQFNKKYKTAISKPMPQEQPSRSMPDPNRDEKAISFGEERVPTARPRGSGRGGRGGSTRRSSGWNRYWSGGSAMNILGFGSKRTTYDEGSVRSSLSQYSEGQPSQVTQTSAMVPPLKIGGQPELSRVVSGSPRMENPSNKFPLTREMSGKIERTASVSTLSSYDDRHDAFSSGIPASINEQNSWTPVDRQDWAAGRAPSNAYTESVYATTLPHNTVANFPKEIRLPASTSQRPPLQQSSISDMSWLNLGGEPRI